jgi:DNA-binding NtrC family response regulator
MSTMQQSKEQPIRILSASADPQLNQSRALLLRSHGFDVTTSESSDQAREHMTYSLFDVLIFGATLARDTCWELAEVFRQCNSDGKIIEIVPSPEAPVKNQPDAIVVSADEPSKLVTIIRDNLREIAKSKEDDRWKRLCSQAAVERDPDKLMELLQEINRLLDEKDERHKTRSSTDEQKETS